jgi:hypothetical protein
MNRLTKTRVKHASQNLSANYADLDFDQLESRVMLAGDVDVHQDGDTLFLTGDNLGNFAIVEQIAPGSYAVFGDAAFGGTTTVSGDDGVPAGVLFFNGVSNISVDLGSGNDILTVGTFGFFSPTTLTGDLNIDTGANDDVVFVGNGGSVVTIAGEANIDLGGATALDVAAVGNAIIGTEPNETALRIFGGNTGTDVAVLTGVVLREDLLVDLGDGANTFVSNGLSIAHDFEYYGGDGVDTVSLTNTVVGASVLELTPDNLDIFLYGGNDVVGLTNVAVQDRLAIDGGSGNDIVSSGGAVVDELENVETFV